MLPQVLISWVAVLLLIAIAVAVFTER